MLTAGIDLGARTTKVVILKDGNILGKHIKRNSFDAKQTAIETLSELVEKINIDKNEIEKIVTTGVGRNDMKDMAYKTVTEVTADARAAKTAFPSVKTVIDIGAEEGRAISVNEEGLVKDFAVNEKCAAGAGSFTESMARALEIKLEDMGDLSLKSDKKVPMNAQCAIFAESEVVSLIHSGTPKEDIVKAVHDAIASRIVSMARKVGIEKDILLIGGLGYNKGFVKSLNDALEQEVILPDEPEYYGAYGAAVIASE